MSSFFEQNNIPKNYYVLREPGFADPDDPDRPSRLCICFSDAHFTDGTVGNQSADEVVWEDVFDDIADICVDKNIEELSLVLVGDVADMIRTSLWSQHGVYPWQRAYPQFKEVLRKIMDGIIKNHALPPEPGKKTGFFYLLKQLPHRLAHYDHDGRKSQVNQIRTLVLLGNHDKEILADDVTLKKFYEECLGQPVETLSDDYRRWLGKMYFGDENHYLDPERKSVPWLPFYWGDRGFKLFVTHGQWRDEENSRRIAAQGGKPGWQVKDGWRLDVWQNLEFAPFTEACFGDTVAAGVLSGFIFRAKINLEGIEKQIGPAGANEIQRLQKILDELDLYRPTSAALKRIIQEIWRLRGLGSVYREVRKMIENELLVSVRAWLSWDFTMASASPSIRWRLKIAKPMVTLLKLFGATVSISFIYFLMSLLDRLQQLRQEDPSYKEMKHFPGFLDDYRNYGFRIHGEGHTHVPLQEELNFDKPADNNNYTYINFGAWRNQVVPKQTQSYRRRGGGRILAVLDKATENNRQRSFDYWVQDVLSWSNKADRWGVDGLLCKDDKVLNPVQAEVFSTELEQARELLAAGYRVPAAVICGVVLETNLRALCEARCLAPGKLDKMNADLAKAGQYNSLVQKRITALAAIRNSSAHGNPADFGDKDVLSMIEEVERLVTGWLS